MVTPAGKRKAVAHLMEAHQVSQRRACGILQIDRSLVRYLSRRGDDVDLCDAIKRVSRERRRFGYRRIHVMVAREGFEVNHKKVRRIYTEEKLQMRRRGGRKRALGTRKPMVLPDGPNQRWSLDFVSDALTDGRRFRILAVVDDFSRENLVLIADTWLSGQRVARELGRVIAERGMPKDCVGQPHRVHQHGDPEVGSGYGHRLALHRARKAPAERLHRKLQWQAEGRVPQRNPVWRVRRCTRNTCRMARGLQLAQTTFSFGQDGCIGPKI